MKEGSTLQSPSSSSSFLLSLSFLLFSHLHRDLSLLLSPGSRPFFSIFPFFSLFFSFFPFAALASHGLRPSNRSIPGQRKRVFSALQLRPANNRERVTPCSAYHTHYPPIFFFLPSGIYRGQMSCSTSHELFPRTSRCYLRKKISRPIKEFRNIMIAAQSSV